MQHFIGFFTAVSPLELTLIFFAKMIEVAISTLRQILINKGYRMPGTVLSFFEIVLWTFLASRVVTGIVQAPVKGIVYSLGFSLGVYLGSKIENYIGLGKVLVTAIVSKDRGENLIPNLRKKGYGVTVTEARGRDSAKQILQIFANRRGKETIIEEIYCNDPGAMITTNDVNVIHGGYISKAQRLFSKNLT